MLCGVAESCERMFGKLLIKLQQADLPVTQPLAELPIGHNFKKDQIMHIVNNIPKGTAPGMDDNRVEYYMYYADAPSAIAADAFQRAYNRFVNVLA